EDIKEITQFLSEKDIAYYLETNSGLFASENCIEKIKEATEITLRKNPERFIDSNNPYPKWFFDILNESRGKEIPLNEINKLSFINTEHPFIMIKDKFQDRFEVYESTVFEFGDKSGEIGLKGLDKQD